MERGPGPARAPERRSGGTLKAWAIRAVQLALTVVVTWFIVDRVGFGLDDLRALDPSVWTPTPGLFLLSCVLLFGGYAGSAWIWGRIVVDLGGPSIPAPQVVRIFMVANLGRYVPGKVWQIAGLAVLARRAGVPGTTATAAAVVGQGVALVAASAVGLGALFAGPPEWRAVSALGGGALAAGVGIGLLPPVFDRVVGLWFRLARQEAPASLHSGHAVRWLGLYLVNWIVYAASFWVLAESLGLSAGPIPVAASFAAAWVLGYVMIFAPAGVGVREGFLVALLTPHLGPAPSGALAVVARLWTTAVEVVPAGWFWLRHLTEARPAAGDEGATHE